MSADEKDALPPGAWRHTCMAPGDEATCPECRERAKAETGPRACVRSTVLREVITEAIGDAERAGMTGQTRDEWVSIAILGSSRVPLEPHFPAEGGGPCPACQTYVIPPAKGDAR